MAALTVLSLPVDLPIWGLAGFKINRPALRALLGEPHFVETDPRRTCGDERDTWGFLLPTGQRLLVVFDVTSQGAQFFGDPAILGPILDALGIAPDDQRIMRHDPWTMT